MKAKIHLWYSNHKNVINTTKFLLVSLAMLLVVYFLDVRRTGVSEKLPTFLLLSAEMSKGILTTLSGVFLTVATFTFTTILTVMTTYSSNFTPRVVQRFISKPYVLSLIGIFIGGFFYSVLSLFMLQDAAPGSKLLAGSFGVIYAIGAMVAFMFFVQQVIRDIKSINLIQDIFDDASRLVDEEAERRRESQRFEADSIGKTIHIFANRTGYFYDIDSEGLLDLLRGLPCELVVHKRLGEYISRGIYIADLNLSADEPPAEQAEKKEEFLSAISDCFILNRVRNISQDYHYEITTLIEIALRAISPGINDPNSAINCIGKIAHLLGQLFATENRFIVIHDEADTQVIYTSYSVEEELYLSFYQLIHYGKEDPSVAYAILEGLYLIYMIADESAKESVSSFFDYASETLCQQMDIDYDRRRLQALADDFAKHRNKKSDAVAVRDGDAARSDAD